nr:hypothetical protein CparaKRNrm3_p007 [Cryptomonas paramecium]
MNHENAKTQKPVVCCHNYKLFFKLLIKFYNFKKKNLFPNLFFFEKKNFCIFHKFFRKTSYLFQESLKKKTYQTKKYQINLFLTYFILITNIKNCIYQKFFKNFLMFCKNIRYCNSFNLSLKSSLTYLDISAYFFTKVNEIYIYKNFKLFYQLLIFADEPFVPKRKKKILKSLFVYDKSSNFGVSKKTSLYIENFLTRNSRFGITFSPSVNIKKNLFFSKKNKFFFGNIKLYDSWFEKLISLKIDHNFLSVKKNFISNSIYFWKYRYANFLFSCILLNSSINKNIIKLNRLMKQVTMNKLMQKSMLCLLAEFSKFDRYRISCQILNKTISFFRLYKICQLHIHAFQKKGNYFPDMLIV